MPRKPRNPGSGKTPVNTPARGVGWGGARSGSTGDKPASGRPALYPRARLVAPPSEGEGELLTEARATWVDVMRDPREPALNRMVAAEKLRDDIAGKPVQKIEQRHGPLEDIPTDDLARFIAALEHQVGAQLGITASPDAGSAAGGVDEAAIGKPAGLL